jgi:hypothetical protein
LVGFKNAIQRISPNIYEAIKPEFGFDSSLGLETKTENFGIAFSKEE